MPDDVRAEPTTGWRARLDLAFDRDGPRSRLARRSHEGPLVVQKPLYPEGADVCQCIVVHPPGGIAGGDRLGVVVDVGAGARVQLTTPGAAKWYRADGRPSGQRLDFTVGQGGVLEWLPQSSILFDGIDARSDVRVELAHDSVYIAFDVVCLGRTASNERFGTGTWRQRVDVERDDALVWSERTVLRGGDALLQSRPGLERRAGLWHIRSHGREYPRRSHRGLPLARARARRRQRHARCACDHRALPRRFDGSGPRVLRRAVGDRASGAHRSHCGCAAHLEHLTWS